MNPPKKLIRLIRKSEIVTDPEADERILHDARNELAKRRQDKTAPLDNEIRRNILPGRWAMLPLTAAAVLAFFLSVFWPGGSPGTISWADVQKHFEQARTLVVRGCYEITPSRGKETIRCGKAYHKNPGLLRIEFVDSDADLDTVEPSPKSIVISKREPGLSELLTLYPDSKRAEWITRIFRTNGGEPSFQPVIDDISETLKLVENVTKDKTNRIGDRVINDTPVVGFSFEVPAREFSSSTYVVGQVRGQIWVRRDDGLPIRAETEWRNALGENIREEAFDMEWNVPLEDSLFDFSVPEDWHVKMARIETAEYVGTRLAPGITLQIGPAYHESLVSTEDVDGVVGADQTTHPNPNIPRQVLMTIELKKEAAKHLHDYADAYPEEIIVVNFNGQIKVVAQLNPARPTQLSFDLSLLSLSVAELEARYFTTTIERNKS